MTEEELEGYPTNNLDKGRDFSVFDRLAKVAKMANRVARGPSQDGDLRGFFFTCLRFGVRFDQNLRFGARLRGGALAIHRVKVA